MPLVGIDCRFVTRKAGLGTYTRELVSALLHLEGTLRFVLFTYGDSVSDAWIAELPPNRFTRVIVNSAHYSLAEHYEIPKVIRRAGIDLFFAPHFNVPFFCPVPYVVTIHDLILHRFAGDASVLKRGIYRVFMLRSLRKARSIIAVSHFTAAELASVYGRRIAKKTTVIMEGVSKAFFRSTTEEIASIRARYALPDQYLLYVGNSKEHKNIPMLLSAHRTVPNSPPIICVSDSGIHAHLQSEDRVKVIHDASDAVLRALYSGATVFVTASLYEGFCLPILEARACGCPVIAFSVSAIPEVAGKKDLLVEPNIKALKAALSSLPKASDPPDALFNWVTAAKESEKILLSALTL